MAWIRVESSVARNRKFVKAGPAASWLWLCGLAYCQEGLTDGFIPPEAIDYLGVPKAGRLVTALVLAGLWDACDGGGWRVHDYLDHNRSASDVQDIRAKRGEGGKLGGRPKKNLHENLPETTKVMSCETFGEKRENPSSSTSTDQLQLSTSTHVADERLDVAFAAFQAAYPGIRRKGGYLAQGSFISAAASAGGSARLMAALANHVASEQWSNPKMIPGMDVWLSEERWRQELPAANVDAVQRRTLGPSYGWECPHVEPCGAPGTCHTMTRLGRPVRAQGVAS